VFFGGSVWCGLAAIYLIFGRPRRAGCRRLCDVSVVSRHRPRHVQWAGTGTRDALIMIVMSAAPVLASLGGALDHSFGWRSNSLLSRLPQLAIAPGSSRRNSAITLRSIWSPSRDLCGLIGDRRFAIPAATASLIMAGCSPCFRLHRFIEAMHFTPISSALLRWHRLYRIRRGHAGDETGTTLRSIARSGRTVGNGRQQRSILLISMSARLSCRFWARCACFSSGRCQSTGRRSGALSMGRRPARPRHCGFLANDERRSGVWLLQQCRMSNVGAGCRVERIFTAGSRPVRAGPGS
jgi:hypothetical protein